MKSLLRRRLPGLRVLTEVSYRELTTLGVGSRLPLLTEPASVAELAELIKLLKREHIAYFVFGGGSNVVGMDSPYRGVGIRLAAESFSGYVRESNLFYCGAQVKLPVFAAAMANLGMSGVSKLIGIPGTLGGAVRMNAGTAGTTIGEAVRFVEGIDGAGNPWKADAAELSWNYRSTSIPGDVIITRITLELAPGSVEAERAIIADELAARRRREPEGRTAGCAFRNVSDLEPAGLLIDRCGLRGFRIGDVEISPKHANYLLNHGSASEADYLEMIKLIRRCVAERFGFYLELETVPVNPELNADFRSDWPAPRVNVLYGGNSSEREVSLNSGAAIAAALRRGGFRVELTDLRKCRLTPSMRRCEVVYPGLHGGFGENGELQTLLEKHRINFIGSGATASALAMDKIATKKLLDRLKLPTANWSVIDRSHRELPAGLRLPVIVKVPDEGSTMGIVRINTAGEWKTAVAAEFKLADRLLVEEYIDGVEITVPILNGEALEAIEIRSPGGFYDYDAKYLYKKGHTEYFCPPESLDAEVVAEAKRIALAFYRASGCRDLLRVDFIVGRDRVPYVLEGNSLPGCTATSLVPKAARAGGMSFERMTSTLVYAAMKRAVVEYRGHEVERQHEKRTALLLRRFVLCPAAVLPGLGFMFTGVKLQLAGSLTALVLTVTGALLVLAGAAALLNRVER